jgi:hypothetical protein
MVQPIFALRAVDLEKTQGEEFDQPGLARKITNNAQPQSANRMCAKHLKFITEKERGRNLPRNIEFMVTGRFETDCIFSIAHPHMYSTFDKGCIEYMIRTL